MIRDQAAISTGPPSGSPAGSPAAAEVYRLIRDQLQHEDNLVTQRLSWFLASQAFLFSAFAIVLNGPAQSVFGSREQMTFFRLIPIIAIAVGLLIWLGVWAGVIAMLRLRREWHTHDGWQTFPPIQGASMTRLMGQAAPLVLPPLFVSVWCILLAVG